MPKLEKPTPRTYYIIKNGLNEVKGAGVVETNQVLETIHEVIEPYEDKQEWLDELTNLAIDTEPYADL